MRNAMLAQRESRSGSRRNAEAARKRQNAAHELFSITDFSEIDVVRWNGEVIRLRDEQQQLETNSDQLRILRESLREVDSAWRRPWPTGWNRQRFGQAARSLECLPKRAQDRERQIAEFPDMITSTEKGFVEIAGLQLLTLENADACYRHPSQLAGRISNEQRRINESMERMLAA